MPKRGSKRVKKKTHVEDTDETEATETPGGVPIPRSMIVKAPKTTLPHALKVLQAELRKIMSPNTALNLKERKHNILKDYISMAPPLKVTHLMVISPGGKRQLPGSAAGAKEAEESTVTTGAGALLKIGRLPGGPTLTMRVVQYSLCRQVRMLQKRNYDAKELYDSAPLVVLNNFGASDGASGGGGVPAHIKLMRITFQNMFPALDVASVKLSDCRRVVLFNYDKDKDCVEWRHYAIRASNAAVSRPVKRVLQSNSKQLPDLGHLEDISDWLLSQSGAGGDASDSEAEDEGSRVVLPQKMRGRGNHANATAAVKLSELGPRVTLKLFKVERGLCAGDVMFHAIESRTPAEVTAQRLRVAEAEAAKRKRREEQEGNVARKAAAAEEKRAAKRARREARAAGDGGSDDNGSDASAEESASEGEGDEASDYTGGGEGAGSEDEDEDDSEGAGGDESEESEDREESPDEAEDSEGEEA